MSKERGTMRFGTLLIVFGTLGWPMGQSAHADLGPDPGATQTTEGQITKLIEQLGAKSYALRRRASRELVAIGTQAKAALVAARNHRDPEVRRRVHEVLETVLELDFHLRLEAFLSDADGRSDHGLAGWGRFRALAGESGPARRLFAAMQQAERPLLEAAENDPSVASELLEERCEDLQTAMQPDEQAAETPSLGSVAALLFVAGDGEVAVSPVAGTSIYGLSFQDDLYRAATSGEKSQVVKRLLGAWVRRSESVDWTSANQSCFLAVQFQLKEGIDLALDILHGNGAPQHVRQVAVQTLARLGGKEVLSELAALLDDRSVCATRPIDDQQDETIKTLICDVALASMIYLTGQELGDYYFDRESVKSNPVLLFDASSLGFAKDEAREAALKKWKEWEAANGIDER
jgi:hypothetical protein